MHLSPRVVTSGVYALMVKLAGLDLIDYHFNGSEIEINYVLSRFPINAAMTYPFDSLSYHMLLRKIWESTYC
jgi:hypothetical protein